LSDGVREAAELGKSLKKKGAVVLEAAPPLEPWRVPGEIANSIERDSDGLYSIERAMIKPLFDRGGELMSGIKLSPLVRAEQVVGVAFDGIREDSLLERLGIESGDVLLSLDDKPCTTLAAVVDALQGAREADRMVARLERQGQPFELQVRVR
jgi:membrane-associated protease RseP (regulator of RpoE activity)